MPLYSTTVVVPYRMENRENAPIYSLHIDTVASTQQVAATTAKVLTTVQATLRHGKRPEHIFMERAVVGNPMHQVPGPYLYLFNKSDRIPNLSFPRRIGDQVGLELNQSLAGIDPEAIYGSVMDGAQMSYINTNGLTALIEHHAHAKLHLCRLPSPIQKVMNIVGLMKHLAVYPDLHGALQGLMHSCQKEKAQKLDAAGFQPR